MAILGSGSSIGGLAGSGSVSRLLVVVSGNTSQLESALSGATKSVSSFGASTRSIGKAMTRSVTLPLVALGGVALKLASDYDSAIGRVAGLTTVLDNGKHTIGEVSDAILKLSTQVPTAPTELANAFYFAGSAGLNFANAMKVVELSSKGAAIGMGNAADISKVLIFALNAFKGTGLTAAHAMDVLTAAIKLGTAEPNEMAIALGRLLPIARDAGLSFDTVAASVAALTNIGLPTRVATTSLRALFTELLAPTEAATTRLKEFGISAQQLRNTLKLGPVAAFQLLTHAVGGNVDALHDIIPQIRGFTAFTGLSGDALKTYKKVIEGVTHSQGTLGKAFKIISKTPAFQFELALNKLRVAGIQFGNTIVPVFLKVMQVIGDFGTLLSSMPDWARTATVAIGLVAAAMGPLLTLFGNITNDGKGMFTSFKSGAIAITTMAAAAALAVGGLSSLAKGSHDLVSTLSAGIGTAVAVGIALKGISTVANSGALGVNALSVALASMSSGAVALIALAIGAVAVTVAQLIGRSHEASAAVKELSGAFVSAGQTAKTFGELIQNVIDTSKASEGVKTLIQNVASSLGKVGNPVKGLRATFLDLTLSAARMGDALVGAFSSAPAGLVGQFSDEIRKGAAAIDEYNFALSQGKKANLGDLFASHGTSIDEFVNNLRTIQDVLGKTDPQFAAMASRLADLVIASNAAGTGLNKLQIITEAQIASTKASAAETDQLAKHFGISTDFMNTKLQQFGVTSSQVLGGGKKTINAFGKAAFGSLGKAVAREQELAAATAKMNDTLQQSLGSSIDLFGKLDLKVKGTTDHIVANAQKAANASLREAEQAQSLAARGVPADLIDKLIGAGPGMVAKFASATKGQLGKLVTAYEIQLGAIDASIIKEGEHQKGKGKDMVAGFVQAILSSEGLTTNAGHQIVNSVAKGLQTGKLSVKSIPMLQDFVRGMEASGLPKQAGSKVAANAVQGFTTGKISGAGLRFVARFAQGLRAAKIPPGVGAKLISGLVSELEKSKNKTLPAGRKAIAEFAKGINTGKGPTKANTQQVVHVVTAALGRAAQTSHAQPSGANVGHTFGKGIVSSRGTVSGASKGLAKATKGPLAGAAAGAFSDGAAVGSQFAAGIASKAAAAAAAAAALAAAARNALHNASKNSPKYFTYYMGQEYSRQLAEGMGKDFKSLRSGQHSVQVYHRKAGGRQQSRMVLLDGDIKINGMDAKIRGVAREEAIGELSYRGL